MENGVLERPRLTTAIREFGGISKSYEPTESKNNVHSGQRLSWEQLQVIFRKNSQARKSVQTIKQCSRSLLEEAGLIVGKDENVKVKKNTAVDLFIKFYDEDELTYDVIKDVKSSFRTTDDRSIKQAFTTVQEILLTLNEQGIKEINYAVKTDPKSKEFGRKLKLSMELPVFPTYESESDSDSDNEAYDIVGKFKDFHKDHIKKASSDQPYSGQNTNSRSSTKVVTNRNEEGLPWLRRRIANNFGSEDIVEPTLTMLKSNDSDEQLQMGLCELLGFENFELVGEILRKRQSLLHDDKLITSHGIIEMSNQERDMTSNYGCQVTVQTDAEKQVAKAIRKEEKKAKKLLSKNERLDEFDPVLMREQRNKALALAASAPHFSQQYRGAGKREAFPNVYDSKLAVQQTAAFVGGMKLSLPEGCEITSNKQYEEIKVPAIQAYMKQPWPLIKISDMHKIAQLAFSGIKQLNTIQSCVYKTAYQTNENLLICAPTGAGKTNVAMLTIVKEIMSNVVSGVIQKDKFKIVYVAPMKALAAEMTENFGRRLSSLGIVVKELTGDMQLKKSEIMSTQMLITTPEKWDVVTRKSTGDEALSKLVKLLIIDEVHLLHDERGPVLETLVARTLRQVETQQTMIRIIGLSATLPNYTDVARFLRVNLHKGLFFFDGRFRPVPLRQTFVGVKAKNILLQRRDMDEACYDVVLENLHREDQVLVFVHARNATIKTGEALLEIARERNETHLFSCQEKEGFTQAQKTMERSRNRELKELFRSGLGCHHAGMLRSDRTMIEKLFSKGLVKVLCCTATLAWGVNLPAHAVVIKGTQVYNAKQGSFVDLGILDVMQVFGRAGRPQFDTTGEGTIITTYDKLSHYLSLMTRQNPIESQFVDCLVDNLNAEIALGTVNTVEDGVKWLSYTYLYTRLRRNPLVYGINHAVIEKDPNLVQWQHELITLAGRNLDKTKMIRFDQRTGYFYSTDLGRTASHFYIKYKSIEVFNECMKAGMDIGAILSMISKSHEFEQVKVREDEMQEMDLLQDESCCVPLHAGPEDTEGKVNILLQTFISQGTVRSFSLISDLNYISQNAARIIRGVFEIVLKQGMARLAGRMLKLCKCVDKRLWPHNTPLRQFFPRLSNDILRKIEDKKLDLDQLKEYTAKELGSLLRNPHAGEKVVRCISEVPFVYLETSIQPITRTILRIKLSITPDFRWNNQVHGAVSVPFWIWVEDPDTDNMYHSEYIHLTRKQVVRKEPHDLVFTIPLVEPHPSQYMVYMESDTWFGSSAVCPISFQHLILPERHPPHTELLDLDPLPITALQDPRFEEVYNFTHFNPIQTQIFHCLYHSDSNSLIGAPTGSGKTVAAELSIFRMLRTQPGCKAVYVAPLKALVRERIKDWKKRLASKLDLKIVELTGDNAPDMRAVARSDVIITTPEKWDGVSRSWHTRGYVQKVALVIIDEIHLLGQDRGPVLEVIVSRTNFISSQTERNVRIVGLSTALANARDLADWLNINQMGLFNFRPSVRPVPMEVHIQGFAGKHYCPRMATMNKPAFQAIRTHSPVKPTLVFVSSRRQTRVTAFGLISYLGDENNPKQWLHMDENEMNELVRIVRDPNLCHVLSFGIGIHHAGLVERDRTLVERLFAESKIQVLIATSTLAWGVNLPAHLVIVKGTEYFDGKNNRYKDFPITDVLQMMGRAGRPQFDDKAVAVILVHDVKKAFYKKFLYEPFPVESSLLEVLEDHLNAEVVAGTIANKQEALDYLTWTYFYRRLMMNPTYYGLQDTEHDSVNEFLSKLLEKSIHELRKSGCLAWEEEEGSRELEATRAGEIASFYYLSHLTMRMLSENMHGAMSTEEVLVLLSNAQEYHELPVRHNEDGINSDLSRQLPVRVDPNTFDSAHTKALLLLYAHLCRVKLPSTDYVTDLKSVLDQAIRVLQAFVDTSAAQGWIVTSLRCVHLIQMMSQGCWWNESSLLSLPHVEKNNLHVFETIFYKGNKLEEIYELVSLYQQNPNLVTNTLHRIFNQSEGAKVCSHISQLPQVQVKLGVRGWFETNLSKQLEKLIPSNHNKSIREVDTWVEVHSDQEYFVTVNLKRVNSNQDKVGEHALTPRFPKPKLEGWFLVLGYREKRELVAVKRVSTLRKYSNESLAFLAPSQTGRVVLTLWLVSDTYLGLDQIYDVRLNVIEKIDERFANNDL